jgi:hypothetical protein
MDQSSWLRPMARMRSCSVCGASSARVTAAKAASSVSRAEVECRLA